MNIKFRIVLFAGLLFSGAGCAVLLGEGFRNKALLGKSDIKVRPTHGDLQERKSEKKTDSKIELIDKDFKIKKITSGKTTSLIKRSAILSHGKSWTLVPRGAVLHVPANMKARVDGQRKGKLVSWEQFLGENRNWIQTQQVSMIQARGEALVAEETVKVYKSTGRVVVAVCHNGPISVKPAKEEKPALVKGAGPAAPASR